MMTSIYVLEHVYLDDGVPSVFCCGYYARAGDAMAYLRWFQHARLPWRRTVPGDLWTTGDLRPNDPHGSEHWQITRHDVIGQTAFV